MIDIDDSKFADFTLGLKTIARHPTARQLFDTTPAIYQALLGAAKRYVPAETLPAAMQVADALFAAGYQLSLEYIGEDTLTEIECEQVKDNYLQLIAAAPRNIQLPLVCTDLSNIGMYINNEIARKNLIEMIECAQQHQSHIMINMEQPDTTQDVLDIYYEMAQKYGESVGITLQAHLFRSMEDVHKALQFPGRIRLVKGVFKVTDAEGFQPNTPALQQRFLELVEIICKANHPLSIATQNPQTIDAVIKNKFLNQNTEIEMLHGVTPDILRRVKAQGYQTRIYLAYGTQWFLHLLHRIAEYPPNIFQAVSDCLGNNDVRDNYYF